MFEDPAELHKLKPFVSNEYTCLLTHAACQRLRVGRPFRRPLQNEVYKVSSLKLDDDLKSTRGGMATISHRKRSFVG